MKSEPYKKKIPLGISSYREIITENYYYVDKTKNIEILENIGPKYQIMLRPRRFGKTLFADTLSCYYDIRDKESFDELFGDTYIGKHKTKLANSFYIFHLTLSGLDSRDSERLEISFDRAVKAQVYSFLKKYSFATDIKLNEDEHFVSYTNRFLVELGEIIEEKKLFIIIDEYDHFANSLIGSKGAFEAATSKDGFVRNFYEVLKNHTRNLISRIFITGVTSLTMDSLTSGFNISENVSDYEALNDCLGFTCDEVADMIDYMRISDKEKILQLLTKNYNGYLFSPKSSSRIYNSNMILYFFNSYQHRGLPEQLVDPNIRGDYLKLSAMFDLYKDVVGKETALQQIMSNEPVKGTLVTSFSLIEDFSYDHFISLLYYLGLLTLDQVVSGGKYQFKTPNAVIREIYYDYYYNYLTERSNVTIPAINEAIREFEEAEDITPLVNVVEEVINDFTNTNNRYMIHFRENSLQTLFFLMLRNLSSYNVTMEYKIDTNFIDILLAPIQGGTPYAVELKYISASKL